MIGKGKLEPFILQPLDSSVVKGIFNSYSNADEDLSLLKLQE